VPAGVRALAARTLNAELLEHDRDLELWRLTNSDNITSYVVSGAGSDVHYDEEAIARAVFARQLILLAEQDRAEAGDID